jgi:outer membrane protein OmpA-like peptidoglycan-associated protein
VLPVLLALAAVLFIPLVRGARRGAERAGAPTPPPASKPIAATNPAPEAGPAATLRAAPPPPDTPAGRDQLVRDLAVYLAAPATEVRMPQRFTLPPLGFESGGVNPSSEGSETLNQIAAVLQAHPSAVVRIESFTDNVGRPEDSLDFSRRRSEAIKALLVEDGADATRIDVSGLGQQHPIARNDTEEGRRQNRRTDLVVTQR